MGIGWNERGRCSRPTPLSGAEDLTTGRHGAGRQSDQIRSRCRCCPKRSISPSYTEGIPVSSSLSRYRTVETHTLSYQIYRINPPPRNTTTSYVGLCSKLSIFLRL
jgi:hypothetical protein